MSKEKVESVIGQYVTDKRPVLRVVTGFRDTIRIMHVYYSYSSRECDIPVIICAAVFHGVGTVTHKITCLTTIEEDGDVSSKQSFEFFSSYIKGKMPPVDFWASADEMSIYDLGMDRVVKATEFRDNYMLAFFVGELSGMSGSEFGFQFGAAVEHLKGYIIPQ